MEGFCSNFYLYPRQSRSQSFNLIIAFKVFPDVDRRLFPPTRNRFEMLQGLSRYRSLSTSVIAPHPVHIFKKKKLEQVWVDVFPRCHKKYPLHAHQLWMMLYYLDSQGLSRPRYMSYSIVKPYERILVKLYTVFSKYNTRQKDFFVTKIRTASPQMCHFAQLTWKFTSEISLQVLEFFEYRIEWQLRAKFVAGCFK